MANERDEKKSNGAIAAEYRDLVHAMQSGVALGETRGADECKPKHLRVGINAAMCDHAALAILLISKGVLSEEEYFTAIRDEMRREVDRYERKLGVTLA